ncbi:MAG: MMPL family transporter [Proteobacteria bacterium]|nr:MMPL family transporter [Pseudomonadota bacterium]
MLSFQSNQGFISRLVEFCIRRRVAVVVIVGILTAFLATLALKVEVKTVFNDLLPTNHPYIKIHEQFKKTFGSSNLVSIMLEVREGDIFTTKTLGKIQKVTTDLQLVHGVNQFQIISLAAKKMKEVNASTEGIDIKPLMWPEVPDSAEGIARLKDSVLRNPLVYGSYVSLDMKAALITVDFYDNEVRYDKIFDQIGDIARSVEGDDVKVRLVGEPILYGWVNHYLPETGRIFFITIAALILLLFVTARTWRGTLLPLLAGVISAIWALGSARLLGFHLDPLVIVVAFLITARAISHSVQLVIHYDDELSDGAPNSVAAAKAAMQALFKPGILGVVADAGCMIVVILTPIPLLQKVSIIGTVWVTTIALSACILTPVLLSWIKNPRTFAHPLNIQPVMHWILRRCVRVAVTPVRYAVVGVTAVVFVVSGIYAFNLKVGDANPGSPILWGDSAYNQDAALINQRFAGADRMFVVVSGDTTDSLKEPAALETMAAFQTFLESQPEVGATLSIADVVPVMKRIVREGNPRFEEFGLTQADNGEILYLFTSGTDPGDIDRFVEPQYKDASVTIFFRDHQGETIRTAVSRVEEFVKSHPDSPVKLQLAGGLIGVLAAVNEIILSKQIESIALALLVLVICCAVTYRSLAAGMFFMVPVLLSNTLTFSFMAWKGIGMNINTLPIAALGIGLGVDYALYVVDEIRVELRRGETIERSIELSLMSAGRGVLITAATLITSVVIWNISSIRFQAEMGVLMALWLFISAVSSLLLMPALVVLLKPRFIFDQAAVNAGGRVPPLVKAG